MAITSEQGFIQDDKTGLYIPQARGNPFTKMTHPLSQMPLTNSTTRMEETPRGAKLEFDEETMILKMPFYGSGYDDKVMSALVRGRIANGFDQLPDPLLATAVSKRQAIVGNWEIMVSGRKRPAQSTISIFAMAEDGQGATSFSQNFIGALDVNNAGAFVATLPLHYGVDALEEIGVRFIPIEGETDAYSIEIDKSSYINNRGLWTLDRDYCQPTGNPHYPFWIYKKSPVDNKIWKVLVPKPYGIQKIQQIGPKSQRFAGYGQSGTWRFIPYMVRHFLVTRGDFERMIAKPPMGIFAATGVDTVGQFKGMMEDYARDQKNSEQKVFPGVAFLEFEEVNAKVFTLPWYNPPDGYNASSWYNLRVECLAASFHMSPNQFQMRLGDGARSQGDAVADIEERVTMAWLVKQVNDIYQEIALPRVVVTVINPSDRQKALQAETASKISDMVMKLEQSRGAESTDKVFEIGEIRHMIETWAGIPIDSEADETYHRPGVEEGVDGENSVRRVMDKKNLPAILSFIADETPNDDLVGFAAVLFESGDEELFTEYIIGSEDSTSLYLEEVNMTPKQASVLGHEVAEELIQAAKTNQTDGLEILFTRLGIYLSAKDSAEEFGKGKPATIENAFELVVVPDGRIGKLVTVDDKGWRVLIKGSQIVFDKPVFVVATDS